MKKVLENRGTAIAVTVLLCLIFAVLGINRSIAKEAAAYTRGFYDGVATQEGYTSASLYSTLKSIDTYALTLSSVYADVADLETERETLQAARRTLVDAMESGDIQAMYSANRNLSRTAEALMTAADELSDLSRGDEEKGRDAYAKLQSAEGALERNPYNDSLADFDTKVMSTLPVRLFKALIFVKGPQVFAYKEL